jgi:hypothetical protein
VAVLVMDMARRALVSGTGLGRITRRAVASLAGDARCGHWTGAAALTSPPGAASRVRFAFCSSVDPPVAARPVDRIGFVKSNPIHRCVGVVEISCCAGGAPWLAVVDGHGAALTPPSDVDKARLTRHV